MTARYSSLRARFQLHLSTAIALMFVAGALLWMNISPSKDWPWEGYGFGWPWIYMEIQSARHVITSRGTLPDGPFETFIHWSGLRSDLGVWLVILICVWAVCEFWIQWRTMPK